MTTIHTTEADAVTQLKDQHRAAWAAGAYADVAGTIQALPTHLLALAGIEPGQSVLDVATGTGNVALRAAELGAEVTGLDLVPDLLDIARARDDGRIAWIEGDAEALPFADASFDRVLSVVGVQFAPRHQVVADELVRVCRPGGAIGLVNWTPEGLIGRMFKILGSYLPKPPAWASPPPLWGSEEHQRTLFAAHDVSLSFERGVNPWVFPSIEDYVTFFEERYGPTIKAKARLSAEGSWETCRAELRALYEEMNEATDGTLHIGAEYLVTIAKTH
jgi:ubiquinone/menaquinone biosynthesis C-methylase UbiE